MGDSRRAFLSKILIADKSVLEDAGQKTLVCVFLRGGADTLNMFVPYADDTYYRVRPTIAIPKPGKTPDASLKIDDFYSLHPRLSPLEQVFAAGELAVVQAVGTDNPTGSHFETQDQMEHGEAYGKTIGGGWLGRYLRSRAADKLTPLSAVAIGETVPESFRSAPVTSVLRKLDEINMTAKDACTASICSALASMYSAECAGFLAKPGDTAISLLKKVEKLRGINYKAANGAVYKDDEFSAGLKEIARLIKSNLGLEVAFIDLNGLDTHFVQGAVEGLQAQLIEQLGAGLAAFWKDLGSYNRQVTTLVMTEFGRRIYENGSLGTDHGRGFAFMLMGSRLARSGVLGKYPGLQDDQYDLGPGGLKISCDYRDVLAEVLSAYGAPVDEIFPGFERTPLALMKGSA